MNEKLAVRRSVNQASLLSVLYISIFYIVTIFIEDMGQSYIAIMGLIVILFLIIRRGKVKEDLAAYEKPITLRGFITCVGFIALLALPSALITEGIEVLLNQFGLTMELAMTESGYTEEGLEWLILIYSSILAPTLEEAVYRGGLMTITKPYGKVFAILITSLLFSLMHGNLAQIPITFFMGLIFGFLRIEYSLIAAIALHLYNNFLLVDVLGFIGDFGPNSLYVLADLVLFWGPGLFAIYFIFRKWSDIKTYIKTHAPAKDHVKWAVTSPGFLFAVLIAIGEIILSLGYL